MQSLNSPLSLSLLICVPHPCKLHFQLTLLTLMYLCRVLEFCYAVEALSTISLGMMMIVQERDPKRLLLDSVTAFISSDLFLMLYQGCFVASLNLFGGFNTAFFRQELDSG